MFYYLSIGYFIIKKRDLNYFRFHWIQSPFSYLCHNILALIATALDSAYDDSGMGLFGPFIIFSTISVPVPESFLRFLLFFTNIYNKPLIKELIGENV